MNIMIGTSPRGKGGIAAVVSLLECEGFFHEHKITYVISHDAGGRLTKTLLALRSVGVVAFLCARDMNAVVHAHSASRSSFLRKSVVLAIARAFRCKTICHLHGGEFKHFATVESSPAMRWWIRHTFRHSSAVIALSQSTGDFVTKYAPGARVEVVPNSVVVPVLDAQRESEARILFLGRAEQRKGIFDLLQAIAILKKDFPRVRLVVGGDGDLSEVHALAKVLDVADCTELLGWIGPDQKAVELAKATVFALPSYYEGLPMAMLEAMAAGKAVVVTSVGGIPEVVTDTHDALLIPPGDPQALASALGALLGSATLRKCIATNARYTIERRFSSGVILARLHEIYASLQGSEQNQPDRTA